jgi:hypothetical protein
LKVIVNEYLIHLIVSEFMSITIK